MRTTIFIIAICFMGYLEIEFPIKFGYFVLPIWLFSLFFILAVTGDIKNENAKRNINNNLEKLIKIIESKNFNSCIVIKDKEEKKEKGGFSNGFY